MGPIYTGLSKYEVAKVLVFGRSDTSKGCWEWLGDSYKEGYGRVYVCGKEYSAHRLSAYLYLKLDINNRISFACHKCNNRVCFNPDHLYVGDNTSNQNDVWKDNRCKSGHELTPNNTYWSNGRRQCRACVLASRKRFYKKR